jgi:hypothetical protein
MLDGDRQHQEDKDRLNTLANKDFESLMPEESIAVARFGRCNSDFSITAATIRSHS